LVLNLIPASLIVTFVSSDACDTREGAKAGIDQEMNR
jgi:hypothetical protein